MDDCVLRDNLVISGVPQGSHLIHVQALFYADDIKLFLPVRGFRDCLKIQSDLNRLAEWCEANAL
jgi:hypothetical protein